MNPAVSIVVATYNYGRFLGGALDSILGQTYRDFEVVVVDDGSSDDTESVVLPYLADPRVAYHRTDHLGQPRAKNAGIRRARGSLVAFLDADDLWEAEKLERQVALFRVDPGLGVAYSRRRLIDESGAELSYVQPRLHRGNVLAEMFRNNFVCFSSAVVRRELFDELGLFDESIPMSIDFDLWLRVASRYRFDYVDEPLVRYRVGHANLSRRVEERSKIALEIMRRFVDDRGGKQVLDPALVALAFAETYCNTAACRRYGSRLGAFRLYLHALYVAPWHRDAWRGLVSLPVPEVCRKWIRRAMGRSADWRVRKPADGTGRAPGSALSGACRQNG